MAGRRIFLDAGGHVGESLAVAMEPRWGFDRLWTFEPASACHPALLALADARVEVVTAGLWSSDTEMEINDPGSIGASIEPGRRHSTQVERCPFVDVATWMSDHIDMSDDVWMKVNIEAAEVEVLGRLIDSGQIDKIDHLVVHFDVEKFGKDAEAATMRTRLDETGIAWREARSVLYGRTTADKTATWLAWTFGDQWHFRRARLAHLTRARIWRMRKAFGLRPGGQVVQAP